MNKILTWLVVGVVIAIIILLFYFYNFSVNGISEKTDDWNNFGGYLSGTLGVLFNLVSAILIYYTFNRQESNSITYQNKIEELQKEQQAKEDLSRFETTFFNLLKSYQETLNSLSGDICIYKIRERKNDIDSYTTITGKELLNGITSYFLYMFDRYYEEVRNLLVLEGDNSAKIREKLYDDAIKGVFKYKNDKIYSPYLYNFYHFIKFINNSKIPYEHKQLYLIILKSQLSNEELFILFYAGMFSNEFPELRQLLDENNILENLKSLGSIFDKLRINHYPKSSFRYSGNTEISYNDYMDYVSDI